MKAAFREIQEWLRRIGVSNAASAGVEYVPSVQAVELLADSQFLSVPPLLAPMAWSGGVLPPLVLAAGEFVSGSPNGSWVRFFSIASSLAQVWRWGVLQGSTPLGTVCTVRNMVPDRPSLSTFTLGDSTAIIRLTATDAQRINVNNSGYSITEGAERLIYVAPGNVFWMESVAPTGASAGQMAICWSDVP